MTMPAPNVDTDHDFAYVIVLLDEKEARPYLTPDLPYPDPVKVVYVGKGLVSESKPVPPLNFNPASYPQFFAGKTAFWVAIGYTTGKSIGSKKEQIVWSYKEVKLTAPPPGGSAKIHGKVTNAAGAAVPGTVVIWQKAMGNSYQGVSNATGDYEIIVNNTIDFGTDNVEANASGYNHYTSPPLTIAAGADIKHDIKLSSGAGNFEVEVTVVDDKKIPIAHAFSILTIDPATKKPIANSTTDAATGKCKVALPRGLYHFLAHDPAGMFDDGNVINIAVSSNMALQIEVKPRRQRNVIVEIVDESNNSPIPATGEVLVNTPSPDTHFAMLQPNGKSLPTPLQSGGFVEFKVKNVSGYEDKTDDQAVPSGLGDYTVTIKMKRKSNIPPIPPLPNPTVIIINITVVQNILNFFHTEFETALNNIEISITNILQMIAKYSIVIVNPGQSGCEAILKQILALIAEMKKELQNGSIDVKKLQILVRLIYDLHIEMMSTNDVHQAAFMALVLDLRNKLEVLILLIIEAGKKKRQPGEVHYKEIIVTRRETDTEAIKKTTIDVTSFSERYGFLVKHKGMPVKVTVYAQFYAETERGPFLICATGDNRPDIKAFGYSTFKLQIIKPSGLAEKGLNYGITNKFKRKHPVIVQLDAKDALPGKYHLSLVATTANLPREIMPVIDKDAVPIDEYTITITSPQQKLTKKMQEVKQGYDEEFKKVLPDAGVVVKAELNEVKALLDALQKDIEPVKSKLSRISSSDIWVRAKLNKEMAAKLQELLKQLHLNYRKFSSQVNIDELCKNISSEHEAISRKMQEAVNHIKGLKRGSDATEKVISIENKVTILLHDLKEFKVMLSEEALTADILSIIKLLDVKNAKEKRDDPRAKLDAMLLKLKEVQKKLYSIMQYIEYIETERAEFEKFLARA